MRKLSRHMPPLPPLTLMTMTTGQRLGCCVGVVFAIAILPVLIPPIAALAPLILVVAIRDQQRREDLAAERQADSICTFARSFPRRSVDPWVVRAVYEELPRAFGLRLPPRATDRFDDDYRILDDDLDDLIVDVADRVGRSLDAPEDNPHYGRVETVGDVVRFLSAQPPSPAGLALRPYLGASR